MKRWSYATAIMLSLAGGTIMTGCIDNDEPYGIEQIRLATADFLKSKKAAVEAEAAAANAQVEIEKIKAETEKLKIEADAAIKAAQAKILEAIAAKRQAEADDIKAKTEAYIAEEKAKLDERIALAAINVKDAERKYQEALYEFEQEQAKNAACANDKLYRAVTKAFRYYLWALNKYNSANDSYLKAQQEYAASLVDLEWVEEKKGDEVVGGHFESPVYKQKDLLEENLANAEAGVKRAQEKIDLTNQAIADVKANDLYAVLEKYEKMQADNTEALEKAKVELEAVKIENAPLYEKWDNVMAKIKEASNAPIAIAPYTYVPDANLSIPNFEKEIVVVKENVTYTLADADEKGGNYRKTKRKYTNMIASLTDALMDDNDKAWTQAALNELQRRLQEEETQYTTDKAAWENAKAVYNNGGEVNAAELPLEAEVEAAVAAYNEIGEKYAAVVQKKADLNTAKENAETAYEEAVKKVYDSEPSNAAYKTYYDATVTAATAIKNAETAYDNAVAAAANAKKTAEDEADADVKNANNATERALSALNALKAEAALDATNETLAAQVAAAQKTYDDAKAKSDAAPEAAKKAKADAATAYNKALAAAETAKVKSINTANETLDTAYKTYASSGEMAPEIDAAYKAMKEAQADYTAYVDTQEKPAWEEAKKVASALILAVDNQLKQLPIAYWLDLGYGHGWTETSAYQDWLEFWYKGWIKDFVPVTAPVLVKDKGVYVNAKWYLSQTSYECFGQLLTTYDPDNGYPELTNEAMLIDNVTRELINEYIKKYNPELEPYQYNSFYQFFGSFGQTLYLEDRIAIAKAYLGNTDLINEVTKTLQANLDALVKSYDDAEAALKTLKDEKTDIQKEITALTKGIDAKIKNYEELDGTLDKIISAVQDGIVKIEFPDSKEGDTLTDIVEGLNQTIEDYEGYLANWNKKVEAAQYQLDQYNNGYTDLENPLKIAADYFRFELETAQIEVNFAKTRLDEAQAKYEAATKKQ